MKAKTTLIAVTVLLLNFAIGFSQAPAKQWDVRFGGSEEDVFYDLLQTSDGGYIFGGSSESGISGDKTQMSQGDDDFWIVKTDANGVKEWDATYGGDDEDYFIALHQTTDGGYILGGKSFSGISGDKTQPSNGGKDFWMVKIDANGVKQWDAAFGGDDNEALFDIRQTTDGGYILGGPSLSGISGDKTEASLGMRDYWIVKTDANGVKQWDASYGGNEDDDLKYLRQTADGGYILGGSSHSGIGGDKTQPSQGGDDYWIIKIDANGVIQWDARYGGEGNDDLKAVLPTADGGYLVGGSSMSGISGNKTQASQGVEDYWLVKTDANGIQQWDVRFGGSENDFLKALQQTSDGSYIAGGYSASGISGDKSQPSHGETDFWIIKISDNGEMQWEVSFGGDGDDDLKAVEQTTDGGYIVGGKSLSDLSGDKTQACQGSEDYWIIKTDAGGVTTGTNETIINQDSFGELYPNPVSQSATVTFSLNEASSVVIQVMDVNGRSLKVIANSDFSTGSNQVIFNRESLNAGIYFLQMKSNEGVVMKKMIVE